MSKDKPTIKVREVQPPQDARGERVDVGANDDFDRFDTEQVLNKWQDRTRNAIQRCFEITWNVWEVGGKWLQETGLEIMGYEIKNLGLDGQVYAKRLRRSVGWYEVVPGTEKDMQTARIFIYDNAETPPPKKEARDTKPLAMDTPPGKYVVAEPNEFNIYCYTPDGVDLSQPFDEGVEIEVKGGGSVQTRDGKKHKGVFIREAGENKDLLIVENSLHLLLVSTLFN